MDVVSSKAGGQIRGWMEMPLAFLPTGAMLPQAPEIHASREDGHGYRLTLPDASAAIPDKCNGHTSNDASNGQANREIAFGAQVVYLQHHTASVEKSLFAATHYMEKHAACLS